MIVKNSKEEINFVAEVIKLFNRLNTNYINSKEGLKYIIQEFTNIMNKAWCKHVKMINITKHSKS